MWKKKGCSRERNLREIYTENNVGTTARPSFLIMTLEGAGGQTFLGPRGIKYLNTGLGATYGCATQERTK
jgi:hypothetical protein